MISFEGMKAAASNAMSQWRNSHRHKPLKKASFVELFFDLVFIFCMRSILPVITGVEDVVIDWYTYYTFTFTFVLMLQIWFSSTIFMNRFGSGGPSDIVYLFTTMFLLFVMTQAISTSWDYYVIYNVCWILIIVNTMVHWLIRFSLIPNPSKGMVKDTKLAMGALGAQAALIALSHLFPHNPAQVVCLLALLTGFVFWFAGTKDRLNHANREHLAERCALLMVLTFGETLIGYSHVVTTELNLFAPIMYFLLIVGMFLVYLNEIANLLDLHSLGSGRAFMAISAWLTFCVANVTAGFELSLEGKVLIFMDGGFYFGLSVVLFLLSIMLFIPLNAHRRPPLWWMGARVAACLLVLAQTFFISLSARSLVTGMLSHGSGAAPSGEGIAAAMMVLSVAAVYAVLAIDRIALRRMKRRLSEEAQAKAEGEVRNAEVPETADAPAAAATFRAESGSEGSPDA